MTSRSRVIAPPAVVIHVPHASTDIPLAIREQFAPSDLELRDEVRLMTDHLTDVLFEVPPDVATIVRFPVSRLAVDPERFEDDPEEPMAARGMGVIYQQTAAGRPLRRALSAAEREQLLAQWYRPHHAALADAVDRALEAHDRCLIIDAHSFPSKPLPYELDQREWRPDICIGEDGHHTPAALAELAVRLCEGAGWSVDVNRPFGGALVPMRHYRRDRRVTALMIEVNRGLYLDETTGAASATFETCRSRLQQVIIELCGRCETTFVP